MLKILGKPVSINVRKVLWLCEELGLPYELEPWGAGWRSTDTPEFRALNPNAMVPVLLDPDVADERPQAASPPPPEGDESPGRARSTHEPRPFVLWESNTICRYLAGKAARDDLLPREPRARAGVEQWMDWQGGDLNNAWRYAFLGLVRQSPAHQDPQALAEGVRGWNRHMGMFDEQLRRTGAFAAGATFTLADIVLGLSVHRWFMTPMERPELPAVAAYYELLSQRPAFLQHGRNGTP